MDGILLGALVFTVSEVTGWVVPPLDKTGRGPPVLLFVAPLPERIELLLLLLLLLLLVAALCK